MAMSNRDVIGQGLELLASGLGPFVDAQMTAAVHGGQDSVLAARDRSHRGTGYGNSLSDARFLLRVVTEQRRAFNHQLSRSEQSLASELRGKWQQVGASDHACQLCAPATSAACGR
jgi:hypothetical protein